MRLYDCVQLSPAWWDLRRGRPTASDFDKIITPAKEQYSSAAGAYIDRLVAETIRFDPPVLTERPMSPAMHHGQACEPEARRWYEMETGLAVRQVGFCATDDERFGCSPDGLIGAEKVNYSPAAVAPRVAVGGLELKCPQPETQVSYLRAGTLPREYKCQVHGCLAVTGADWWDFVSYCPCFDPLVVRVYPDEFTNKLRLALIQFWDEYATALSLIHKRPVASGADVRRLIRGAVA